MSKFRANERVHLDTDLHTIYADGSPVERLVMYDEVHEHVGPELLEHVRKNTARPNNHVVSYDVEEIDYDKAIVVTIKGRASHEVIETIKQSIREELKLHEDFPVLVQDDSLSIEFRDLKSEKQISNELFELKEAVSLLIQKHNEEERIKRNAEREIEIDRRINKFAEELLEKVQKQAEKSQRFKPPTL
jgi:hypothetical protein